MKGLVKEAFRETTNHWRIFVQTVVVEVCLLLGCLYAAFHMSHRLLEPKALHLLKSLTPREFLKVIEIDIWWAIPGIIAAISLAYAFLFLKVFLYARVEGLITGHLFAAFSKKHLYRLVNWGLLRSIPFILIALVLLGIGSIMIGYVSYVSQLEDQFITYLYVVSTAGIFFILFIVAWVFALFVDFPLEKAILAKMHERQTVSMRGHFSWFWRAAFMVLSGAFMLIFPLFVSGLLFSTFFLPNLPDVGKVISGGIGAILLAGSIYGFLFLKWSLSLFTLKAKKHFLS